MISLEPFALVPWQIARRFLSRGNLFVSSSNLRTKIEAIFQRGEIDLLLIDDPRLAGVEKLLQPRAFFYRPTDFYGEMKGDRTFITVERKLLENCAGIIATSEPVRQHVLTLRPGLPSLLLENGVDFQHFSVPVEEPEELKDIPHPRVVYVGAIDDRFNQPLAEFLAASLPDVHFVLIGPGTKGLARTARRNLHLLGPIPYVRVPGFLRFADIGLLPLVDNLANAGRSPMKLYEYGAAGLPVLATSTLELQRRNLDFVHLVNTQEEAAKKLANVLQNQTDRKKIAESCRIQSWSNKVASLLNFVSLCSAQKTTFAVPTT